jgi:endonuclease YncB( thermonuclease family)
MNELKRKYLFICLISINIFGYSQNYTGSIIRVIDGDTYFFQTGNGSIKVRMFVTDAPENNQPYYKESADFLKQYLNKDAVTKIKGTDRYRRSLGTLYVDGQDINLLSIKNGCAWHFKRYSNDIQYAHAEEYARKNKLGLWGLPYPIPPWNWRNLKQKKITEGSSYIYWLSQRSNNCFKKESLINDMQLDYYYSLNTWIYQL